MKQQRPWLLTMLITSAALSAAIGAMATTAPAPPKVASAPTTRLGAAIADDLKQRAAADAGQANALDLREQTLRAAQARLNATLKAKEQADQSATSNSAAGRAPGGADTPDQFDTLARIYQAMKPAKAAPVFSRLDLDVQYLVAKRMRERSTAMILAAMQPEAAARLSMALAGKKPETGK
jgi:flagellar motility protein MotE (MotC chaperone)